MERCIGKGSDITWAIHPAHLSREAMHTGECTWKTGSAHAGNMLSSCIQGGMCGYVTSFEIAYAKNETIQWQLKKLICRIH